MTPFKRLSEADGRDAWLESAAEQVKKGDVWAALSPEAAEQLAAKALRGVRETQRGRTTRQRWVIALAVLGSSLALAALGNAVQKKTEPPSPLVGERAGVRGPSVEEAPRVIEPAPIETPVAAPEPAPAPKRFAKPRPAAEPQPQPDILAAESQLLLTALQQLRNEHNPAAALETLDAYAAQFPNGTLKDEAEALRKEASP